MRELRIRVEGGELAAVEEAYSKAVEVVADTAGCEIAVNGLLVHRLLTCGTSEDIAEDFLFSLLSVED